MLTFFRLCSRAPRTTIFDASCFGGEAFAEGAVAWAFEGAFDDGAAGMTARLPSTGGRLTGTAKELSDGIGSVSGRDHERQA